MISRLMMVVLVLGLALAEIPPNFDARDAWPGCVGPVYNQGGCNSSWAHAAAGMVSDRYCISKNVKVALTPQMLLSCVVQTCSGSFEIAPITSFVETKGLPTRECVPYAEKAEDVCPDKCKDGKPLKNYACKFSTITGEANIKTEIMKNGPVVSAFEETMDFPQYYDGIYYHAHSKKLNTYATVVKVVGWGYENGINYWVAQNSVGTDFGENGYIRFKIPMALMDTAYACTPTSSP